MGRVLSIKILSRTTLKLADQISIDIFNAFSGAQITKDMAAMLPYLTR